MESINNAVLRQKENLQDTLDRPYVVRDKFAIAKKWMESDRDEIIKIIGNGNDLVCTDFITSREKAEMTALRFLSENVDAVVIIYLAWGEDELVIPFINNL